MTKVCSRCRNEFSKEMFNKDKRRKDGLTYHCKSCVAYYSKKVSKETRVKQSAEFKKRHPDRVRKDVLKRVYNLSWEAYQNLLEKQNNSCFICLKPLKLHKGIDLPVEVARVDHNHKTGCIRGLLCNHCNTAIGLLKDEPALLKRALQYLGE